MTTTSHIRRIALIAVLGCAILASWSSAAVARPIDDPALPNAPTTASPVAPPASSSGGGIDLVWPVVFGATVVLVAIGTAGYTHRTRSGRHTIA